MQDIEAVAPAGEKRAALCRAVDAAAALSLSLRMARAPPRAAG